jgi:carbonic anhydrase/acetyltransferase-like protein (isoleucine patch superfamily)
VKKLIGKILFNAVTFEMLSLFVYAFYCVIFAIALIPSFLLVSNMRYLLSNDFLDRFIFLMICFVALYIFWVCAALVVGFVERMLTLGFKEGCYLTSSSTFLRWLIVSGLHLWALYLVLPFLQGSNWIKIYLRIVGAKIGKNVFINSRIINDAYLLTIEDNVIIGGDAVITCHLFENGMLVLGRIHLCKGVSIGANSYITPGVKVEENAKIGVFTKLRRNQIISKESTIMALPGMNLRQVAKIIRYSKTKNDQPHINKKASCIEAENTTLCNVTQNLATDKELLLEEYRIICSYITSRDALRWTILGAAIGVYGLILSNVFENPEWNIKTLAMLIFGCFILSVATFQNTRLYEYCKMARRRAVSLEKNLNMYLYSAYKDMKLPGASVYEIPKSTGWFFALLPIILTFIVIGLLIWSQGLPSL